MSAPVEKFIYEDCPRCHYVWVSAEGDSGRYSDGAGKEGVFEEANHPFKICRYCRKDGITMRFREADEEHEAENEKRKGEQRVTKSGEEEKQGEENEKTEEAEENKEKTEEEKQDEEVKTEEME